jgi:homocysteine S-methyltransferase
VGGTTLSNPLTPFLADGGVLIVDGALATELERLGADLHDPLWSASVLLHRPTLIRAVHDAYFAVGADVAITATYQATFEGLLQRGVDAASAAALMQHAVRIAVDARDARWEAIQSQPGARKPLVAASVGPYGAFLADGSEYRGDYSLDEEGLVAWHRARFRVLAESGADLLACETIPCRSEVRAFLRLLDELPGARAWITCTARDGIHLASGESFAEVAREAGAHPQVVAVGVNCTAPSHVTSLIRVARAVTAVPIVVYPNSGERYDATAKRWSADAECAALADWALEWRDAGASLIGGCCRTSPGDIAEVRRRLR